MNKINILIGKNIINSSTVDEEKNEENIQKNEESLLKKILQIFKKNI